MKKILDKAIAIGMVLFGFVICVAAVVMAGAIVKVICKLFMIGFSI